MKMVTMPEEYTTENQRSVVHFLWAKGLNAKDINKEMFPAYGGKCLSHKGIHNWVKKFSPGPLKVAGDA
jgi:transposase-like protein